MSAPSGPSTDVPPAPQRRVARDVRACLAGIVLAALVLSVFWQTGGHEFLNFDDDTNVSGNSMVLRGLSSESVSWAFSAFHAGHWHPLTWLSHMAVVDLFGTSPAWHHRVNALLHLMNTELLFLVLWRMTGGLWQSAFAAALFGVHPLHVEPVAWVTERRELLSALFVMLTMGAYLRYVRRPGVGRYFIVAGTFSLALLSKAMPVTLPFALLLLDFWPLGRFGAPDSPDRASRRSALRDSLRLAREKIPLIGLSAIACVMASLAAAKAAAFMSLDALPIGLRVSNAVVSYVVYLWKTAWPASLAVIYPHPATTNAGIPAWKIAGSVLLLGGFSAMALWQGRLRPYLAVGWLWYLGTLVPVIGLFQAGPQAYADRYTYVPLIGIFIAIAWGIPDALSGLRSRRLALGALAGASLAALSAASWVQTGYWRDSVALFSRAASVTGNNWVANSGLGTAFSALGQNQRAIGYFREALRIKPGDAVSWNNLGLCHANLGRHGEAIGCYREAVRFAPDFAKAWNNMGLSYGHLGQHQQAIGPFQEAVRIKPDYAEAWNNMGLAYGHLGQHRLAIDRFREAVRIRPDYAEAWNNLGAGFGNLGQYQLAIRHYEEALRIRPGYAEAWNNRGVAHVGLGQRRQADECFRQALRIRPDYIDAWNNLNEADSSPGRSRRGGEGPARRRPGQVTTGAP